MKKGRGLQTFSKYMKTCQPSPLYNRGGSSDETSDETGKSYQKEAGLNKGLSSKYARP